MVKHGTRTMYVHYKCRCDECCRAEHIQYLKRKEAKERARTNSKWSDERLECSTTETRRTQQRTYNKNRYDKIKKTGLHTRPISWREIAEKYNMKCTICGCGVDENDFWIGEDGRKRFGRRYPTVDHIIPLKHEGTDTLDNIQLACKRCNSAKGAKLYD